MKSYFTPGPWRVAEMRHVVGLAVWSGTPGGSDEYRICALGLSNGASLDANAKLISAAPDLLSALRRCAARILIDEGVNSPIYQDANAAIAKAVMS